jgi:hypothetical protein
MATLQFEDRVLQALRHLPEDELALVKSAFDRLADGSGSLPDAKPLASDPNVYVLRASPELRVIYRREERLNGTGNGHQDGDLVVVEDIASRRVLDRFLEPCAS